MDPQRGREESARVDRIDERGSEVATTTNEAEAAIDQLETTSTSEERANETESIVDSPFGNFKNKQPVFCATVLGEIYQKVGC